MLLNCYQNELGKAASTFVRTRQHKNADSGLDYVAFFLHLLLLFLVS